jgi:hypothetical protein
MKLCRLEAQAGRKAFCPEATCPFWEPGGAVLEGRCAFELIDLEGRPALAAELLSVRRQLEAAEPASDESRARRLFHRVLNASDEE